MVLRLLVGLACFAVPAAVSAQAQGVDPTTALVVRLEQALAAGDSAAALQLAASSSTPGIQAFTTAASPAPTRFIIKERDRAAVNGSTERLLLEVFSQYGNESVITTWRMDVAMDAPQPGQRRISDIEQLSIVSGLHRLALNPAKHYEVRNLTVQGTDLALDIPAGHAFVAETDDGPTAMVILGRGRMRFDPSDPAERTQIRLFSGNEALATEFDTLFLRVRPGDFDETVGSSALFPRPVGQSEFRRASEVFEQYVGETLHLDLTDLSRERWSLIPSPGDLIAEIRTRRLGSLTYARSSKEAEDISLFDRRRRRNIAVYASKERLAARGRFYSEDELVDYDVQRYDVDASFSPERMWIDGTVQLRVRVKAYVLTSMTLRLAESLVVRSIVSPEYGRLLHLRVVGQNSVIVNFPSTLPRDTEFALNVIYGGRLEPQKIDGEGIGVDQQPQPAQENEQVFIPLEPQYVYSNRSYWYPQATVTDYAPARLRVSVPPDFGVIASGTSAGPPTPSFAGVGPGQRVRRLFVFDAERPVRYLACVISRFNHVQSRQLSIPIHDRRVTVSGTVPPRASDESESFVTPQAHDESPVADVAVQTPPRETGRVTLTVQANPRQTGRARSAVDRAASIFQFYSSLVGDAPYPTFTLAVTENELPGGHSPGYFAMLNHPPPNTPYSWRNDPVAFDNYEPFFLAHEIAHQWWGQAVGWKNYHEQWLSEGFAQYFAAMYAARDRGDNLFGDMLRQMRRWSIGQSSQGPVYLGYRLGHIKGESRVFRALVYNKGAMVLHMLRRLLGDDAFFAGVRQFYMDWKFKKAGTDDLRVAMERVSMRDLSPFFDGWIHGFEIPDLRFTSTVTGNEAQLRFEHRGAPIPVPVTVSISYTDGTTEDIVVPVTEKVVERRVTLSGTPRAIEANRDYGAVAEINR